MSHEQNREPLNVELLNLKVLDMKDDKGLYYYPFPLNKRVRMYVREMDGEIGFRMWNSDDPQLWEEHGWVSYDAIKQAQGIYEVKDFDPKQAYDIQIAQALIKEYKRSR